MGEDAKKITTEWIDTARGASERKIGVFTLYTYYNEHHHNWRIYARSQIVKSHSCKCVLHNPNPKLEVETAFKKMISDVYLELFGNSPNGASPNNNKEE